MKKCRKNIQRSVWAFLVILCCHGNFADDPLPSFVRLPDNLNQQQTQKTVPIYGQSESPFSRSIVSEETSSLSKNPSSSSFLGGDGKFSNPVIDEHTVLPDADFDVGKIPAVLSSIVQSSLGTRNSLDSPTHSARERGDVNEVSEEGKEGDKTTENNPEKGAAPVKNSLFVETVVLDKSRPFPIIDDSSSRQSKKQRMETASSSAALVGATAETSDATLTETLPPVKEEPGAQVNGADESTKKVEEVLETPMIVAGQAVDSEPTSGEFEKLKAPSVDLKSEAENGTPVQYSGTGTPLYPLDASGTPATEDMPSFNEWAKKRLEEQGMHGSIPPAATSQQSKPPTMKQVRHKNYASVDCGAKVINANPESQSTGAVLSHFRDDYMLNPCTAKIWLIIELCESIQADRIDLANFELFSSSPREFSVFSSDRYPTRDWTFLGTFEATDERSVQNFSFGHTSFGKYIKVEMVSHYGSEHFCPLSLVRVFGTSEYEALETEESADGHDRGVEDDDEIVSDEIPLSSHESKNLFGSAKDAVMNIVKKVLRSDTAPSDGAKSKESVSSGMEIQNWQKNCACLQRLPIVDCGEGVSVNYAKEVVTTCPKEEAVAHLRCHYPELLEFLLRSWPGSFHGRLLEQCYSTCLPYLGECSDAVGPVVSSIGGASIPIHPTCQFYHAVLGPVQFGALCHLDKVLCDEQNHLPVVIPQCPFVNISANVSVPSLDFVHIPNATPPVAFATTASHERIGKSVTNMDSYQCDSLDHIAVCSTRLDAPVSPVAPPPPPSSGTGDASKSVILTGIIVTEDMKRGKATSSSTSSSFQSQILPTKTLSSEAETPLRSKTLTPQSDKPSKVGKSVPEKADVETGKNATKIDSTGDRLSTISSSETVKSDSFKKTGEDAKILPAVTESGAATVGIAGVVPKDQISIKVAKEQIEEVAADVPKPAPLPDINVIDVPSSVDAKDASPYAEPNLVLDQEAGSYDEGATGSVLTQNQPQNGFVATPTNGDGWSGNGKAQNGGTNGGATQGQKESVFVRLSNRIKALELNMSLSSQYLEELSRRYRKQMEEMQKAFNKTIGALNETARNAYERDLKQQEIILGLQSQLDNLYKVVLNLQDEQQGLHTSVISRHILLMIVEASIMTALFLACVRSGQKQGARSGRAVSVVHPNTTAAAADKRANVGNKKKQRSSSLESHRRRNSDSNAVGRHCAGTSNGLDIRDRRRPSTEALNVSGTYSDLMIIEPTIPVWEDRPSLKEQEHSRKKKKHKNKGQQQQHARKEPLYRSISNNVLLWNSNSQKPPIPPPQPSKILPLRKNSAAEVSSDGLLFATAAASRVQELSNGHPAQCSNFSQTNKGGSPPPQFGKGTSVQYSFSNYMGYYGGYPPPEFPPKLTASSSAAHHHNHNGMKKAVEKVCG